MATNVGPIGRRRVGDGVGGPKGAPERMAWIAGGRFLMGSDPHYAEEQPAHRVAVDGFWIDRFAVTNEEFSAFVADTGYLSIAEKVPYAADYPGVQPDPQRPASVVFERSDRPDLGNPYNWWRYVADANWRQPRGPGSGALSRVVDAVTVRAG